MKGINKKNNRTLLRGVFISVVPILVLRLEVFLGPFSGEFLMSMLPRVIFEMLIVGIIGVILSWLYIILKEKYPRLAKKIVVGIILVYYLLILTYLVVIIFFRIQAPLLS